MTSTVSPANPSTVITDGSIDIKEMAKEKGNVCVSIIIPTHRTGSDRQADPLEIKKAVALARQSLQEQPELSQAIDSLVEKIDYTHNKDGIGIFVSRNFQKLAQFPFPVTKKILVSKVFDLQDLLYLENYATDYYLLDLSKKEIRLFSGRGYHLLEVSDANFPKEIDEEYEYNKPSQGTSLGGYAHVKGFEKDKSLLEQLRLKKVFQETDKALAKYLHDNKTPLILCGASKTIDLYRSESTYRDKVVGVLSDNFRYTDIDDLEIFAWLQMRAHIDREKLELIDELNDKVGEGKAVYGIEQVWKSAMEGKGFKLLVERDYAQNISGEEKTILSLSIGQETGVTDAVNEIIATVLQKNGKVFMFEKGVLQDQQRIAMINRY